MALAPAEFCWLVYCITITNILGIASALDRYFEKGKHLRGTNRGVSWILVLNGGGALDRTIKFPGLQLRIMG